MFNQQIKLRYGPIPREPARRPLPCAGLPWARPTKNASAASHGRREAPRRGVRGRRGLAGAAASPSRRQAMVGERFARAGSVRGSTAGRPRRAAAGGEATTMAPCPEGRGGTGKSRRAILRAAHTVQAWFFSVMSPSVFHEPGRLTEFQDLG